MDDRPAKALPLESMTREAETILLEAQDYRQGILDIRSRLLETAIRPYFESLLAKHGLTSAEAVRRANLDRDFGRQILTGQRMARRDYYLQLALGMGLSDAETRSMLAFLGVGPLYPLRKRDAAVLYALQRGLSLMDAQLLLETHGLPPLGDPDVEEGPAPLPEGTPLSTQNAERYVREAPDFSSLSEEIQDRFLRMDVSAYFDRLLSQRGLTRAQAIRRAGLKESIGFQLLSGIRVAKNRDAYLRLALSLALSLEETQRMLAFLKKGALYALKERDAALLYALHRGYSLDAAQKLLMDNGLAAL